MTKIEEDEFLISILNDLSINYPQHNYDELMYFISIIKFRKQSLEQAMIAKYNSNVMKGTEFS